MASLARKLTYGALSVIPLGLYERLIPRDVVGLVYHAVGDHPRPHIHGLYGYKTEREFRLDLEFLKQSYHVVGYRELHEHRLAGTALPPRSVVITFDDGFAECHSVAAPILAEFGMPAIFFVNNDFLDNRAIFYRNKVSLVVERLTAAPANGSSAPLRAVGEVAGQEFAAQAEAVRWLKGLTAADEALIDASCQAVGVDIVNYLANERPYMTRDQVVELGRDGHAIGGHTQRHRRLDESTDPVAVAREIVDSCQDVCELTGQAFAPFAFPFRGPVSRDLLARVRADNKMVGLLFDSDGVRSDREFVVQRISCDTTRGAVGGASNLSWLFQEARIRRLLSPLLGGLKPSLSA